MAEEPTDYLPDQKIEGAGTVLTWMGDNYLLIIGILIGILMVIDILKYMKDKDYKAKTVKIFQWIWENAVIKVIWVIISPVGPGGLKGGVVKWAVYLFVFILVPYVYGSIVSESWAFASSLSEGYRLIIALFKGTEEVIEGLTP